MKKLNKFLVLLVCVVLLASSLVACGNKDDEDDKKDNNAATDTTEDNDDTEDVAEEVEMETITVWTDNAHEKTLRDQQIEEFNNTVGKELGINIEYTVYGDNYTDTVKIAAQADEAPDLYRADSKYIQEFIDAEYVIPIEDLPGSEELLDRYSDLLSNQAQIFYGE